MKRLLILSGKGGTGKTSTASSFVRFGQHRYFADCDVDAPNLHLVLSADGPAEETPYYGSKKAVIDPQRCAGCGLCQQYCRFDAIKKDSGKFRIDEYACEGCGLCKHVCPAEAVELVPDVAGTLTLYNGEKVFSTAMLKMGRGNSGKLVSEVKNQLNAHMEEEDTIAIIDGSPGIGCPVIASINGVDLVLIVAEASMSGISDMKRVLQVTRGFGTPCCVCVNKAAETEPRAQEIQAYCAAEQVPFLGCIPFDPAVPKAVNAGLTIADTDGPAKEMLFQVYQQIMEIMQK